MTLKLNKNLHKLISDENVVSIFFQTIKRSLNSPKWAENGFISDLFMRRTMAALTSTFMFLFFSLLPSSFRCGTLFFYGTASFDQKRPLFYSKRWRHFFECAPRLSSRFTWASHFLIYCHFSFVSKNSDSIELKFFQSQMLEQ
jgi:hypothetical protein